MSDDLARAQSFAELYDRIDAVATDCHMIADLAVYDTALRVGAFLGLRPGRVYLHTGTRVGAKLLGLDARGKSLPMDALPEGLRDLEPWEAEDVPCIFKGRF